MSKRRQQQAALQGREAGFQAPYLASNERRRAEGRPPRNLGELLGWFEAAIWAENPSDIHSSDVWRDYGEEGQGGSRLGTPRWSDGFRRYIEAARWWDPPDKDEQGKDKKPAWLETDPDGYFLRPLQVALVKIARGAGGYPAQPEVARWLVHLAQRRFDWQAAGAAEGWSEAQARFTYEGALRLLWRVYRERSNGRPKEKSESQHRAEEAA